MYQIKYAISKEHKARIMSQLKLEKKAKAKVKSYSIEFRKASKPLRTLCCDCGTDKLLQVHHIDFDKSNNELSNLRCLCYYCHSKFHPHMQNKKPPHWLR